MRDLYSLMEEPMVRLRPYLPKSHGRPRVDDRRVLSGSVFVDRNGPRWCDATRDYGPHKTLYNRRQRCGESDIFATRYDRRPTLFFSAVALAATLIFWL